MSGRHFRRRISFGQILNLETKFFMPDRKQLCQIAQDDPNYMFTGREIAELCNFSQNVISAVKARPDHPFFLNKCRPEWFLEWMRTHPGFQLTKAGQPKLNGPVKSTGSMGRFATTIILEEMVKRLKARQKRHADQKP